MVWKQNETCAENGRVGDREPVQLVMYGRRFACGDQDRAQRFLARYGIQYEFIDIGTDLDAARRLAEWVGYLSVPTLVITRRGEMEPFRPPTPLRAGQRVRGLNRDTLITEPSDADLERWLAQHSLL